MNRKSVLFIVVTLAVLVADQASKYAIVQELTTRFDSLPTFGERLKAFYGTAPPAGYDGLHFRSKRAITVSESFFRLRYAENPGAAFGLFRGLPENVRGPLFHLVSLGAVVFIFVTYRRLKGERSERWILWGLPLVLGGAVGNYVDRLARSFVVDFLEAHWMDKAAWPSFNVADSAICVGVGLLLVDSFVRKEPAKTSAPRA